MRALLRIVALLATVVLGQLTVDVGRDGVVSLSVLVRNSGKISANSDNLVINLHGGILSDAKTSSFTAGRGVTVHALCPEKLKASCTYGAIDGAANIEYQSGDHEMFGWVNASEITQNGGRTRFINQVSVNSLKINDGHFVTHGNIFADALHISGGKISGFEALGSSITLRKNGQGVLDHINPISMSGMRLILDGEAQWTGKDLTLEEFSILTIGPSGTLTLKSQAKVVPGVGVGGRVENFGHLKLEDSAEFRVHVINRGMMEISAHKTLTLMSAFTQDIATASLIVNQDAHIVKPEADLVLISGTLDGSGVIESGLQVGGVLIQKATSGAVLEVVGDLLLTPSSTTVAKCTDASKCIAVAVTGLSFLNGAVRFDGSPSGQVEVLKTAAVYGTFSDAEGSFADGAFMIPFSESLRFRDLDLTPHTPTAPVAPIVDPVPHEQKPGAPGAPVWGEMPNLNLFNRNEDPKWKTIAIAFIVSTVALTIGSGSLAIALRRLKNSRTQYSAGDPEAPPTPSMSKK